MPSSRCSKAIFYTLYAGRARHRASPIGAKQGRRLLFTGMKMFMCLLVAELLVVWHDAAAHG